MQSPLCRLAAAGLLCLASVGAAHAQARIEDCEKIQAADAYNQCLAKFGPTSKVKSVEPLKPGDIKDNSAEAAAGAATKGGGAKVSTEVARHAARGHGAHGQVAKGRVAKGRVAKGRGRHVAAHAVKHGVKKAAPGRKRMTIIVKRRK